jgi:hypothetical protein
MSPKRQKKIITKINGGRKGVRADVSIETPETEY